MAERKFAGIDGVVCSDAVAADYEAAEVFDKIRVGKHGVYFKEGFKTRFMAYSRLERVFIRVQEVNGRLCCGNTTFAYFRLVFVVDGKEFADTISENEKAVFAALDAIRAAAPALATGFVPKEQ